MKTKQTLQRQRQQQLKGAIEFGKFVQKHASFWFGASSSSSFASGGLSAAAAAAFADTLCKLHNYAQNTIAARRPVFRYECSVLKAILMRDDSSRRCRR